MSLCNNRAQVNGTQVINIGKSSYSKVVISASAALSLPAEREWEERRDFWVTGIQHNSGLEMSWGRKRSKQVGYKNQIKIQVINIGQFYHHLSFYLCPFPQQPWSTYPSPSPSQHRSHVEYMADPNKKKVISQWDVLQEVHFLFLLKQNIYTNVFICVYHVLLLSGSGPAS